MKQFINKMLSAENGVSSKRVNGMLLLLVFIGGTIYSLCISKELSASSMNLLTTASYLGAGLLAGTLLEKLKKV